MKIQLRIVYGPSPTISAFTLWISDWTVSQRPAKRPDLRKICLCLNFCQTFYKILPNYVYKIAVQKNGEQVLTKEYTSQPTSSPFSYNYSLNASKGDVLKATAYCIIAGSKSAEITVEQRPAGQ
jgi:hypothetical protein